MNLNRTLIVLQIFFAQFQLCFSQGLVQINIGAIFEDNTLYDDDIQMLQYATAAANDQILQYGSGMRLGSEVQTIAYGREYTVSRRVCKLFEVGVGVIIGPESISSANHTMNVCDIMDVPYINSFLDEDAATKLGVLNVYPSLDSLTQLVIDYVNASDWKHATILYESSLWLRHVVTILETNNLLKNRIWTLDLDYTTNNDFRPTLQTIRDDNNTNIILDCSIQSLPILLRQAMEVGLMTKHFSWVIANLDAHSLDLDVYRYSGVNITMFRILNTNHPMFKLPNLNEIDKDADEDVFNVDPETRKIENEKNCNANNNNDRNKNVLPTYPDKFKSYVNLRAALIYDAVMVYAMAISELNQEQVLPSSILCSDPSTRWKKGNTILNYMKKVKYDGLTGWIEFDNLSLRSNITVELLELTPRELKSFGTWTYVYGNWTDRLKIVREIKEEKHDFRANSLEGRFLKVITSLTEPYTMLKLKTDALQGDDRLEGFAVDLIADLAKELKFNYTFIVEEDGNYGTKRPDGKWDGMIGKLMREEVDIAICDLTVTLERVEAIDFSPAILELGIAILFKAPQPKEASTFSFMSPFENEVWVWIVISYFVVSLCFFVLGRICPSEWDNPYPCVDEPRFLETQFTIQNSFWFAAGAFLQQGSEVEVKSVPLRIAVTFWWFFTVIIVSASYTANLAASLTAKNTEEIIKDFKDFEGCGAYGQPKCKVDFGIKKTGSTYEFFKESEHPIFKNMFAAFNAYPDLMADTNEIGRDRVMSEDYAYFMESTTLEYYTQRNCTIKQVGDLIDERNYAIGMRKNYPYYQEISEGVLKLQERGVMKKLHEKWWKQQRKGGACGGKPPEGAPDPLHMDHLTGIFLILFCGMGFALCYEAIRLSCIVRRRARANNLSFREEWKAEFKFLLQSLADPDKPKPVHKSRRQSHIS